MKKTVSAFALGFLFLASVSPAFVSAQSATADSANKTFTVKVAEPAAGATAKIGSMLQVKWTYSPRPSFNQAQKVGITFIDKNGTAYTGGIFSGVGLVPGNSGSFAQTLLTSRQIKVPNVPVPGDYNIKIDVGANAKGGSTDVTETTAGTISIVAAGTTPGKPSKPATKLVGHIMFAPPVKPHPGDTVTLKITTNVSVPYAYAYLISGGQQVAKIDEGAIVGNIKWTIPAGLDTNTSYNFSLQILNPSDLSTVLVNYTSPAFKLFAPGTSKGGHATSTPVTKNRLSVSCKASTASGNFTTADPITWTAASMPADDGTYTYSWSGNAVPSGYAGSSYTLDSGSVYSAGLLHEIVKVTNPAGKGASASAIGRCSVKVVKAVQTNKRAAVFEAMSSFWNSLWH